jgi:hypothetical protein
VTGFPLRYNKATKGEAVVIYRKPLATQKMGQHRFSRRVNKMEICYCGNNSSMEVKSGNEEHHGIAQWLYSAIGFILFTINDRFYLLVNP